MFSLEIETMARLLIDEARAKSLRIVTAESCTGGLVAAAICAVPGASDVFERGFVSYTNRAKQEMLGVSGDLMADLGSVSEPISRMMAEGALENSTPRLRCDHRHRRSGWRHAAEARGHGPLRDLQGQPVGASPSRGLRSRQPRGNSVRAVLVALEMLRDRLR